MLANKAYFQRTAKGVSRFFLPAPFYEVSSVTEQQILFFGAAGVGKVGTWTDECKAHARAWAEGLVDLWDSPEMQQACREFCSLRLRSWYDHKFFEGKPQDRWWGAAHAAYVMFCTNYPRTAKSVLEAAPEVGSVPMSEWVVNLLKEMVEHGPNTWPFRYEQARPVLEALYGVDLPDHVKDLKDGGAAIDTRELQARLIELHYDLGPAGADGIYGNCTTQAVLTFQQLNQLRVTGHADSATVLALREQTDGAAV